MQDSICKSFWLRRVLGNIRLTLTVPEHALVQPDAICRSSLANESLSIWIAIGKSAYGTQGQQISTMSLSLERDSPLAQAAARAAGIEWEPQVRKQVLKMELGHQDAFGSQLFFRSSKLLAILIFFLDPKIIFGFCKPNFSWPQQVFGDAYLLVIPKLNLNNKLLAILTFSWTPKSFLDFVNRFFWPQQIFGDPNFLVIPNMNLNENNLQQGMHFQIWI